MASNGCSLCFWSLKKPAGVSGHPDRLQACEPGNPVTDWPMKKGAPIGPTKTQLSNVKWPVDHCQLKNLTGFLVVGCWKNVKCMAPSTLLAGSHVIAESNFIFSEGLFLPKNSDSGLSPLWSTGSSTIPTERWNQPLNQRTKEPM